MPILTGPAILHCRLAREGQCLAADDAKLPDDPGFRSAFVAYLEWGTRLGQHNSQAGARVAEHAPVPRWGWGEAPPFRQ